MYISEAEKIFRHNVALNLMNGNNKFVDYVKELTMEKPTANQIVQLKLMVDKDDCWSIKCKDHACYFLRPLTRANSYTNCTITNLNHRENAKKILDTMDKEFTLKDITDAMHSGRRIRHRTWSGRPYLYIWYAKEFGFWRDNNSDKMEPAFPLVSDWEYYKEPTPKPKTEKRTFYRPNVYDSKVDYIAPYGYWKQAKTDFNIPDDMFVSKWEEETFETPIEENK